METIRLIKDGETRSFRVVGQSVLATMRVAGRLVSNPLLSALYADGWKDAPVPPTPEPILPTVEELVYRALRLGEDGGTPTYSDMQEFEVQRKREEDPEAFAAYYARVEQCIAWAKSQPHRDAKEGV